MVLLAGCTDAVFTGTGDVGPTESHFDASTEMHLDATTETRLDATTEVHTDAMAEDAPDATEVPDASDAMPRDARADSGAPAVSDGAVDAGTGCPAPPNDQSACSEALLGQTCVYGEQCCCGSCYPQRLCDCASVGGAPTWSCVVPDVCPGSCPPPSDAGAGD